MGAIENWLYGQHSEKSTKIKQILNGRPHRDLPTARNEPSLPQQKFQRLQQPRNWLIPWLHQAKLPPEYCCKRSTRRLRGCCYIVAVRLGEHFENVFVSPSREVDVLRVRQERPYLQSHVYSQRFDAPSDWFFMAHVLRNLSSNSFGWQFECSFPHDDRYCEKHLWWSDCRVVKYLPISERYTLRGGQSHYSWHRWGKTRRNWRILRPKNTNRSNGGRPLICCPKTIGHLRWGETYPDLARIEGTYCAKFHKGNHGC